jgi:pimeloyl-ACP methyl ester carboxylesterase
MIAREQIAVGTQPAYAWMGGEGDPMVLLHGGWGGASMHWSPVWDALARTHRVIAPELPGIAYRSERAPHSLTEAAAWVETILDATDTAPAWIVGNSLGAAVASRLASRSPERCRGLILVDGGPPPRMPALIRRVATRSPVRQVVIAMLHRSAWRPSSLEKAFADPRRAPAELRDTLTLPRPPQFAIVSDIVTASEPSVTPPPVATLVIWGAEDRLPGTSVKTARRLARSLANARVVILPDAGHLPQVEQPETFTRTVLSFIHAAS